jgi:hypothetical protein
MSETKLTRRGRGEDAIYFAAEKNRYVGAVSLGYGPALDGGRLPASGGEKRVVRIAASLAAGHPVSLRDAIPGLDQRNLELVTIAIRRAAGQRP